MRVIGVAGKAGSGKSTTAGFLAALLTAEGYVVAVDCFANGVKREARKQGWNGVKDSEGRSLLQRIGHGYREQHGDRCWITELVLRWAPAPDRWVAPDFQDQAWAAQALRRNDKVDYLIIPDVRYQNELDLVLSTGTCWVKEGEPLDDAELAAHPSEALEIDVKQPGVVLLHRTATLEEYEAQLAHMLAEGLHNRED